MYVLLRTSRVTRDFAKRNIYNQEFYLTPLSQSLELIIYNEEPIPNSLSKQKVCKRDCYFESGRQLHLSSPTSDTSSVNN